MQQVRKKAQEKLAALSFYVHSPLSVESHSWFHLGGVLAARSVGKSRGHICVRKGCFGHRGTCVIGARIFRQKQP